MRFDRASGLVVTLLVLVAGGIYALQRTVSWSSDAQIVLVPVAAAGEASPLDSFSSGGTLGTTVELLASPDLAASVPQRGVRFTVRAVPDSRVIELRAVGSRELVQPALAALLVRAGPAQQRLADRWRLSTLTRPTTAEPSGPGTPMLLLAVALLALLGGIATTTAIQRAMPELAGRRRRSPREDAPVPVPTHAVTRTSLRWRRTGGGLEATASPGERRSGVTRVMRASSDGNDRAR